MEYAKRATLSVAIVALVLAGIVYLASRSDNKTSAKTQVVASFYPLAYFAEQIGSDKIEVTTLTPAGVEPHDYELTAQDLVRIEESDVLIINGCGLESWSEDVISKLRPEKKIIVVCEGLEERNDPHVWLSPVLAQTIANNIGEAVGDATEIINNLKALDSEYKQGLNQCVKRDIVTSHSAFGYLASEYTLRQVSISGISPDEEPSSQQLAKVADFVKKNNIKYIFFESLVSPKLAQTIATETGAQTLVLNPLEGLTENEIAQGENYFTVMRKNLANLKIALECN